MLTYVYALSGGTHKKLVTMAVSWEQRGPECVEIDLFLSAYFLSLVISAGFHSYKEIRGLPTTMSYLPSPVLHYQELRYCTKV